MPNHAKPEVCEILVPIRQNWPFWVLLSRLGRGAGLGHRASLVSNIAPNIAPHMSHYGAMVWRWKNSTQTLNLNSKPATIR